MAIQQLMFFVGWTVAAIIGAALLVTIWQRIFARYGRHDANRPDS